MRAGLLGPVVNPSVVNRSLSLLSMLALLGAAHLALPAPGRAQERSQVNPTLPEALRPRTGDDGFGPGLRWGPGWGRFRKLDYAVLATGAAATVTLQIIGPNENGRWLRRNGFDEGVRRALRGRSLQRQQNLRDASDITLNLAVGFPVFFDAVLTALWFHDNPDVGRELALLAIEAQLVSSTLQAAANIVGSRERPYGRNCVDFDGDAPEDPTGNPLLGDNDCLGRARFRSFYSGHTSQAFAAAATTCVFHARLPLYGRGRDWLACAAATGLATTTGLLRIAGDKHYASDVIFGALTGAAIGWMVPALRMRPHPRRQGEGLRDGLTLRVVPTGLGVGLLGMY